MTGMQRNAAAILAVVFILLHLPFLPPSLEDLDSINFALGLHDFDVAEHQPHPPGYPVFMFVARGVMAVTGSEVQALSLTGVFAGGFGLLAIAAIAGVVSRERTGAVLAVTALAAAAPLYWMTAARPLSDMMGLAAALGVQALLLRARTERALILAAGAAGLAVGVRSQVMWLTLPLLMFSVATLPSGHRASLLFRAAVASALGAALWAVPLVVGTGGPLAYWQALTAQGAEDFTGVTMLLTSFTPRLALNAMHDTFVAPWAGWWLGVPVLVAAVVGGLVALVLDRRPLIVLAVAFGPYLVFHLLLQETFTTRYALPLIVPVAWLAVRGLETLGRPGLAASGVLTAACLFVSQTSVVAYSREDAPAFRMLSDMTETARNSGVRPVLAMHRRGAFDFRRPLRWLADTFPPLERRLDSPPKQEWMEVVRYWNGGGRSPVWFVADPFRSDLALIDHDGPRRAYRWPFPGMLVGGARPGTIDWYVFDRPAWYLGEGWALTPETAGVAGETGRGPASAPIEGWVRRTTGPVLLMVGGRNLHDGGPPVQVTVRIDDRLIDEWTQPPGFFLRWTPLEGLDGAGDYARLTVAGSLPSLAIEQFDAQPAGVPMFGFAEGWHELEFDPVRGRLWRWTSDRASMAVRQAAGALSMRLSGETDSSADSPRLTVRLNSRTVFEEPVDGDFSVEIPLPATSGDAVIGIETDQVHVPAEQNPDLTDRRRLGLRIFEASIRPAS